MKTVILFRHGKSDWDADYGTDHDRPLARRGKKAARKMGKHLSAVGAAPDLLLSSTAVRARKTAEIALQAGGWNVDIVLRPELYGASLTTVLDVVRSTAEHASSIMLVGHEPTWSDAVREFVGGGAVQFPTAAMACIDFDTDSWALVDWGSGVLRWLVIPKALPQTDGKN